MTKTLDKETKAELLRLLLAEQAKSYKLELALAASQRLVQAIEERRKFETHSYRSKLRDAKQSDFRARCEAAKAEAVVPR